MEIDRRSIKVVITPLQDSMIELNAVCSAYDHALGRYQGSARG